MVGVEFTDLTTKEVRAAADADAALILPVAAIEASGPHLPIGTSLFAAGAVAARAVGRLRARGVDAYRLAPVAYAPSCRAASFAGTVALSEEAFMAAIAELLASLVSTGFSRIGVATTHNDPGHLRALAEALADVEARTGVRIALPDPHDGRWSDRLPAEWRLRTEHAGRLDTAVLLSLAPDLVRERILRSLAPVEIRSLEEGVTLEEVGANEAYAGNPGSATAEDGDRYLAALGEMVATAVLELAPGSREAGGSHKTVLVWRKPEPTPSEEPAPPAPRPEAGDDLAETIID